MMTRNAQDRLKDEWKNVLESVNANGGMSGLALILYYLWRIQDAPIVVLWLIVLGNGLVYLNYRSKWNKAWKSDYDGMLAEAQSQIDSRDGPSVQDTV
jgi:hypothetical protein